MSCGAENRIAGIIPALAILLLLLVAAGLSRGDQDGGAAGAAGGVAGAAGGAAGAAGGAADAPYDSTDSLRLRDEKLRQEIRKLELENEKLSSRWEPIRSLSPFLAALVAAMGVLCTIWKQIHESSTQRQLDRRQREEESVRRSNERFTSIVSDLGSDSEALRASAAVSIMTFLKPEYKDFHEQVFLILLANLKIQHSEAVNKLLVAAFGKAVRLHLECARDQGVEVELDLSRSNLDRVDLSSLDLSRADLGFAHFRRANMTGTKLFRVRGMEADLNAARLSRAILNEARFRKALFRNAQFHDANVVAADLKETDLRGAKFHQAKMQSAHLEDAKLEGAEFEQAVLSDTYFNGASLDEHALKSIINAKKWQDAHFDKEIEVKLQELHRNRSGKEDKKKPGQ